jgi:hypothetical protein
MQNILTVQDEQTGWVLAPDETGAYDRFSRRVVLAMMERAFRDAASKRTGKKAKNEQRVVKCFLRRYALDWFMLLPENRITQADIDAWLDGGCKPIWKTGG